MGDEAQLEIQPNAELDTPEVIPEIEGEVVVVLEGQGEEELAPQPPKRNPVRDLRNRVKEQNRENSTLSKENKRLAEALELASQQQPAPPIRERQQPISAVVEQPTMESCGYDASKFQTEYSIWNDAQLDIKLDERLGGRERREQESTATQANENLISKHYERATDFKVGDYEQMEDIAVDILGVDVVQAIQTTVDNSEVLLYHLGSNKDKAAALAALFKSSPGKATLELGKLSGNLTLRPKNGKGAPDPDMPVRGGGGAINATLLAKYQKQLDKAYDGPDPIAAARAVRAAAEEAGVPLAYNRT
jgi:hypothetical protein